MKITWLSTASILIEDKQIRILFDPFLKSYLPQQLQTFDEILKSVHTIMITHPHLDHFSDMDYIIKRSHCPIYVCQKGMNIVEKIGLPLQQFHPIEPYSQFIIDHIKIKTYPSCHCVFDLQLVIHTLQRAFQLKNIKKTLYLAKLNHIYQIDKKKDVYIYEIIVDQIHILLLGSANLRDDVVYPQNVDLLIYPYQGKSHLVKYSIDIFKKIKPKTIILDHFDDAFPPISSDVDCQALIETMKVEMPDVKIIIPQPLKSIVLTKK